MQHDYKEHRQSFCDVISNYAFSHTIFVISVHCFRHTASYYTATPIPHAAIKYDCAQAMSVDNLQPTIKHQKTISTN